MRYRLEIKDEARQQLRALPKEQRRNVGRRLDALQSDLSGDVKKLTAKTREYRVESRYLASAFHSGKRSDQCVCCERPKESI
jgi:mRNA-degrading endonuclease RelE of RelBE toxin-antitoxin system